MSPILGRQGLGAIEHDEDQVGPREGVSRARSIPSDSRPVAPPRSPAVSASSTGHPSIAARIDTTSRVVPAVGETIARSNPAMAFRSRLLPTLGRPVRTTFQPAYEPHPDLGPLAQLVGQQDRLRPGRPSRSSVAISRSRAPSHWSSRIEAVLNVSARARSASA